MAATRLTAYGTRLQRWSSVRAAPQAGERTSSIACLVALVLLFLADHATPLNRYDSVTPFSAPRDSSCGHMTPLADRRHNDTVAFAATVTRHSLRQTFMYHPRRATDYCLLRMQLLRNSTATVPGPCGRQRTYSLTNVFASRGCWPALHPQRAVVCRPNSAFVLPLFLLPTTQPWWLRLA